MIIDGAITLRELKQAVDAAIERHGDHLPVAIQVESTGALAWAERAQIKTPGGVEAKTRLVISASQDGL